MVNAEEQLRYNQWGMFAGAIPEDRGDPPLGGVALGAWYERNIRVVQHLWSALGDDERALVMYGSGHVQPLRHLLDETPMCCPVSPPAALKGRAGPVPTARHVRVPAVGLVQVQMETTHRVHVGDARSMDDIDDESVELVVTSPPYPMVEMWDELFAELDPEVGTLLADGEGRAAFERMHDLLDPVWAEVVRVLAPGGIVCVNIGDAVSSGSGEYQLYPNHTRVTERLTELGLSALPDIVWKKEANSPNDFVGSGMLPTNAYVTLEHEHVLVFRKGGTRSFPPHDDDRYESAYFWEDRNEWFSDLWTDVQGVDQALDAETRARSGAFPFELPYRLIAMYSTYGDTVLDPFWGTGTTSLAAMVAGRSSVGYELDEELVATFDGRVDEAPELSSEVAADRLEAHRAFAAENPGTVEYEATYYDFEVVTEQERDVRLYEVVAVERRDGAYVATHEPI